MPGKWRAGVPVPNGDDDASFWGRTTYDWSCA